MKTNRMLATLGVVIILLIAAGVAGDAGIHRAGNIRYTGDAGAVALDADGLVKVSRK